eukprot:300820-Prymnesium_polylepis.1
MAVPAPPRDARDSNSTTFGKFTVQFKGNLVPTMVRAARAWRGACACVARSVRVRVRGSVRDGELRGACAAARAAELRAARASALSLIHISEPTRRS